MLKETANEDPKTLEGYDKDLEFEPEYKHPTPGEFPIIGYMLSHSHLFDVSKEVADNIIPEDSFTPYVPDEPEDPGELDDRQNVLNFAAAGCNLTQKVMSPDSQYNLQPMLKYLHNKLGAIIWNGSPQAYDDAAMEKFLRSFTISDTAGNSEDYKKVVAFHLKDEPSLDELKAGKLEDEEQVNDRPLIYCYHRLAVKIRDTEGLDGMILINLLPIHGAEDAHQYQEYLDTFQNRFKPAMYSVDIYPILQWNPVVIHKENFDRIRKMNAGEIFQVHERFYRTLEMISAQARKNNRPFWYYPLCGEHFDSDSFYYPAQKEEYLRYSVFTGLAYGANAIVFWRMLEGNSDRHNLTLQKGVEGYVRQSYLRHPINADRTRSPFWYYVRRITREIKRYKDVFLNTEVKGIYHTGLEELAQYAGTRNTKGWPEDFPYVIHGFVPGVETLPAPKTPTAEVWGLKPLQGDSIPVFKSITSPDNGLGVLVSHLVGKTDKQPKSTVSNGKEPVTDTGSGEEYYMIVNHDAANAQRLKIEFNPGFRIRELTPYKSRVEPSGTVTNTTQDLRIERTLNPGGYIIFRLEVRKPV